MKKLFIYSLITLLSLFSLSGCWDDEVISSDTVDSNSLENIVWLAFYKTDSYSIWVPASWEKINNANSLLPKPNFWEIEAAFTSKDFVWGFSNNLLILSQETSWKVSSKDFSIWSNAWSPNDYLYYKKVLSRDIKFLDNEQSVLFIFKAKYNEATPKLIFLQTSHVCDKKVYFFTLALPSSINDTTKYEKILETFSCVK